MNKVHVMQIIVPIEINHVFRNCIHVEGVTEYAMCVIYL